MVTGAGHLLQQGRSLPAVLTGSNPADRPARATLYLVGAEAAAASKGGCIC